MSTEISLGYRPGGQTLERFHNEDHFFRCLLGPLGSGKTTACIMEILVRAIQQEPNAQGVRRSRWLVARTTYPELMSTTLTSWNEITKGPHMGKFTMGSPITHEIRFQLGDTAVELDVYFMALDSDDAASKIRGMEITGAWFNEGKEIPYPVISMATGRVGRFPPMREGGPTWTGIIMDTNMPDDDHWIYRMAEKDHPDGWEFYRQPGGVKAQGEAWVLNPDAENLANLRQGYYKDMLAGNSRDWINVYLAANYGFVQYGRPVYPEYSDTLHAVDLEPVEGAPLWVGADFGLTPAAVICQRISNGQVLVLEEVVSPDVGAKAFGEELRRILAEKYSSHTLGRLIGDPAGNQRAQTDVQTVFEILRAQGLPFEPAHTNSFVHRREAVANMLESLAGERPRLLIDRKCLTLRKGMAGAYHFRRVQVAVERYQDQPEKNAESHVCEALQYAALGMGEGRMLVQSFERSSAPRPRVITRIKQQRRRR